MAIKKPIVRATSRKPATPKTATTTSSAKPLVKDVPATKPSTTRRPVRPVAPPKQVEEPVVEAPKVKEPTPRASRRRAVAPPTPKAKEVVVDGTEKAEQGETRASEEASKPDITSERTSLPTRPRPAGKRAEDAETDFAKSAKVTLKEMSAMSLDERYKLFRSINTNNEHFVGIRKELPKQMVLRKDEAVLREIVPAKAPKSARGLTVYYCPYCVDWQPYHNSWTGYMKCCGCTMSTKDFYTRADNGLFNKE